MSNVFNRGGIINERKINIKGCRKQLLDTYKELGLDYNTPDLELGEIDWLLQSLNFNCMSPRIHLYEGCHHILLL